MSTYLISWSGGSEEDGRQIRGSFIHETEKFDKTNALSFVAEYSAKYEVVPGTFVFEMIHKLDDETAPDVRMSAESLMELQRVAMARAVEAFAEEYRQDRGDARAILTDSKAFAEDLRSGRRTL